MTTTQPTTTTTFLRLLADDDKGAALRAAVAAARSPSSATSVPAPNVYTVDPASFRQIPGSPFAYWVNESVRSLFNRYQAFEDTRRTVKQGLATADDFRFVRAWWEPGVDFNLSQNWANFAKGGAHSKYYSDPHLTALWRDYGADYERLTNHKTGKPYSNIWMLPDTKKRFFLRPGLTYPLRTQGGFSVRVMPAGCIFSHKGPAMFVDGNADVHLLALLAIVNSAPFRALLSLQMAFGSYEVGVVQRTPVPTLSDADTQSLAALAREAHHLKREADRADEVTHPFTSPALLRLSRTDITADQRQRDALAVAAEALAREDMERQRRLSEIQTQIDDRCFALYGFSPEDRAQIERGETQIANGSATASDAATENEETTGSPRITASSDAVDIAEDGDAGDEGEDEEMNRFSIVKSGRNGNAAHFPLLAERDAGSASAQNARLRIETANLLMYALGCAFGRWDVRIGRDPSLAPALAEPFAPLPVCAPGALVGPDGLPAARDRIVSEAWLRARPDAITLPPVATPLTPSVGLQSHREAPGMMPPENAAETAISHAPLAPAAALQSQGERVEVMRQEIAAETAIIPASDYPMPVAWDGILVDDPDAPNDIVRRLRAVFDALYGDRASDIEREVCGILGVRDLREYVRNPRHLFDFHIGRYSKSRRKAPIYWLLQSPKRNYGIWLYYHRLDADLIFKALSLHLLPKIRHEEQRLEELAAAKQQAGATGPEARRATQALDRQQSLLADLRDFRDALSRAANHHLTPDLNDGVLLNIAPYWEVVSWKEATAAWKQLLSGKYDWSSIGKQLRANGYLTAS